MPVEFAQRDPLSPPSAYGYGQVQELNQMAPLIQQQQQSMVGQVQHQADQTQQFALAQQHAQLQAQQAQQHAQLQAQLQQQEMSQTERMRMQRLQNALSYVDQANLDPESAQDLKMQIMTGLSPLQQKAQIEDQKAQAKQRSALADRATSMAQANVEAKKIYDANTDNLFQAEVEADPKMQQAKQDAQQFGPEGMQYYQQMLQQAVQQRKAQGPPTMLNPHTGMREPVQMEVDQHGKIITKPIFDAKGGGGAKPSDQVDENGLTAKERIAAQRQDWLDRQAKLKDDAKEERDAKAHDFKQWTDANKHAVEEAERQTRHNGKDAEGKPIVVEGTPDEQRTAYERIMTDVHKLPLSSKQHVDSQSDVRAQTKSAHEVGMDRETYLKHLDVAKQNSIPATQYWQMYRQGVIPPDPQQAAQVAPQYRQEKPAATPTANVQETEEPPLANPSGQGTPASAVGNPPATAQANAPRSGGMVPPNVAPDQHWNTVKPEEYQATQKGKADPFMPLKPFVPGDQSTMSDFQKQQIGQMAQIKKQFGDFGKNMAGQNYRYINTRPIDDMHALLAQYGNFSQMPKEAKLKMLDAFNKVKTSAEVEIDPSSRMLQKALTSLSEAAFATPDKATMAAINPAATAVKGSALASDPRMDTNLQQQIQTATRSGTEVDHEAAHTFAMLLSRYPSFAAMPPEAQDMYLKAKEKLKKALPNIDKI